MKPHLLIALIFIYALCSTSAKAEEGPGDARRHMIRGVAAIEMAKSNAELALAANEFRIATKLDPNLSAAWYNLGSVQSKLGQFNAAIQSYQHYLTLVPNAEDAQKVQDEIIKLEFRQEQVGKAISRVGRWIESDGTVFGMRVDGNRLTLTTQGHPITDNEAMASYTIVGSLPITNAEQLNFQLELTGNQITGTWMHSSIKAEECTIPEERGEVTGELNDVDKSLVLHYSRTQYRAPTIMSIFPGDYCGGVEAVAKKDITMVFRGPIPAGWPMDFSLSGLQQSLDMFVKIGWFGRLKVATVVPNSPAYEAGLKVDDEIMAIDDVAIKSLTAGEAYWRLFGEVGSEVRLTVLRENSKEPATLQIRRMAVQENKHP